MPNYPIVSETGFISPIEKRLFQHVPELISFMRGGGGWIMSFGPSRSLFLMIPFLLIDYRGILEYMRTNSPRPDRESQTEASPTAPGRVS